MDDHPLPFLVRRRNWLVLLALWLASVVWSLNSHLESTREQIESVLTESARNMFQMVVLTRLWNANAGGVYAVVGEHTVPNPHLQTPLRDIVDDHGRQLTMINPAYMTRQIAEIAQQHGGARFRITSIRPINPRNEPDAWERSALLSFEKGQKEHIGHMRDPDQGEIHRYMAPLLVTPSCLTCHAQQGYKTGDVRGGISVTQSYGPFAQATEQSRWHEAKLHLLVFASVALFGWWLLEQLRHRWIDLIASNEQIRATHDHLLQSEKMASLGRMVAGFAHEINTPIGIAVGAISDSCGTIENVESMLGGDEVSEDALRAALASLREADHLATNSLKRAARMVQAFKRTSIDQTAEEVRVFDLAELNTDILDTLHNQFKRTQIAVHLECPAHIRIQGHPGLIEQILTNLLMNSFAHGFQDGQRAGHIFIEWQTSPGRLSLTFRDDGMGMPKAALEKVFEPFFTTRRNQGGSGLGLYICYNIVTTQLGGHITCQSKPGDGTVFNIDFPAVLQNG